MRRAFKTTGIAVGVLALVSNCSKPVDTRPNVLVILADDLGFADVGWNARGEPAVRTPVLDRLARESLVFDAFRTAPMCTPARAGFLTGRSPLRMGLWRNIQAADDGGMPLDERTLAQDFRGAGYATSLVGKWHVGHARPEQQPLARGFDHAYGLLGGWIDYTTHRRGTKLDWRRDGVELEEPGYATDLLAAEAEKEIRERDRARPFFLWLAFNAPHAPLHVPPGRHASEITSGDENRRAYLLMVEELDRAIGSVLDMLSKEGLDEHTLVFFASDNGGDPRYGASNAPLRGGKFEPYEGGIRVPALLRWRDHVTAGHFTGLATHLDVAPTLCEAAGVRLAAPHALDGISLWPAIHDKLELAPRCFAVGCERPDEVRYALTDGVTKFVEIAPKSGDRARREAYDLSLDPHETQDLGEKATLPSASGELGLEAWRGLPRLPFRGGEEPP